MTQLTYLEVAIAAGVQAAGQGAKNWTMRDQAVAQLAAEEALKTWVRITTGEQTII
jgi:hypothetical protein